MTTFGLHTSLPILRRSAARLVPADHPHRQEGARRALNVAVAAFGLVLASPVLLATAVAIKLTSRGPVLFRQKRVGLCLRATYGGNHRRKKDIGGKPFTMYKFRTMRTATAEAQVWASEDDPRITAVGRFLRRTRLDELPQLFNVLMGDMNIVGPRPEQPDIFQNLRDEVASYANRQQVRPGITGLAQITLHYDTCVDDVKRKVEADLQYIRSQSLLQDLKIMALTAPVMVFRRGSR